MKFDLQALWYILLFFLHDLLNCKDEFNSFDGEEVVDQLLADGNMIHMTVNQVSLFRWSLRNQHVNRFLLDIEMDCCIPQIYLVHAINACFRTNPLINHAMHFMYGQLHRYT